MSASHLGTFPVKTVLSDSITEPGVRTSTAKIVVKEGEGTALLPLPGSVYEFNSSLWVTQAELSKPSIGLEEISISAAGPAGSSFTTVEIQPGGPLIWGLSQDNADGQNWSSASFPARFGANMGTTIQVRFISVAGNERTIADQYQNKLIPSSVNNVALPSPWKSPGTYNGSEIIFGGQPIPAQILYYFGFLCRDIQMQRQGRALVVTLFFRESGKIMQLNYSNQTSVVYSTIFES